MSALNKYQQLLKGIDSISDNYLSTKYNENENFRIGIDINQNVAILINESFFSEKEWVKNNIILKNLEVSFHQLCSIDGLGEGEQNIDSKYTIIKLLNSDERKVEYFLRIASGIIEAIIKSRSVHVLEEEINHLIDIFSSSKPISKEELIGLWGELYFISQSNDISEAITAWHVESSNLFDFSFSTFKVEIKTTIRNSRIHSFSNNQIKEYKNLKVFIGSIMTEEVSLGESINDLWNYISTRIESQELQKKLEENISIIIKDNTNELYNLKLDKEMASNTINNIDSKLIPNINNDHINQAIRNIKLEIDLDAI